MAGLAHQSTLGHRRADRSLVQRIGPSLAVCGFEWQRHGRPSQQLCAARLWQVRLRLWCHCSWHVGPGLVIATTMGSATGVPVHVATVWVWASIPCIEKATTSTKVAALRGPDRAPRVGQLQELMMSRWQGVHGHLPATGGLYPSSVQERRVKKRAPWPSTSPVKRRPAIGSAGQSTLGTSSFIRVRPSDFRAATSSVRRRPIRPSSILRTS